MEVLQQNLVHCCRFFFFSVVDSLWNSVASTKDLGVCDEHIKKKKQNSTFKSNFRIMTFGKKKLVSSHIVVASKVKTVK